MLCLRFSASPYHVLDLTVYLSLSHITALSLPHSLPGWAYVVRASVCMFLGLCCSYVSPVLFDSFACSVLMSVFHCIRPVMYVVPCSHAFTASVPPRITLSICCCVSSLAAVLIKLALSGFCSVTLFGIGLHHFFYVTSGVVSLCGCALCDSVWGYAPMSLYVCTY